MSLLDVIDEYHRFLVAFLKYNLKAKFRYPQAVGAHEEATEPAHA